MVEPENPTGAGTLSLVAGDLDLNGIINSADVKELISQIKNHPTVNDIGDYNQDGRIDVLDLVLVSSNLGKRATGPEIVEPSTVTGIAVNLADGRPLKGVGIPLQVDFDRDGSYYRLEQKVYTST